jgi:hypothetical protein
MSVDIELRKAAALINAARFDEARHILSEYLKDFPESDLAWLLMSYVLHNPRVKQAAATRALRLNPENEQAKARIAQLLKFQAPLISDDDSPVSPEELDRVVRGEPGPYQDTSFSRLHINETRSFTNRDREMLLGRDLNVKGVDDSGARRRTRTRSVLMGIGLVAIMVVAGIFATRTFPQIFMSDADRLEAAIAGTGTALATENVGLALPASWTPTITPTVTNTPTPSPTPTITTTPTPFMTRTLSPTRTPITPDPTVVAEMEVLQGQVIELRDLPTNATVNTNMISKYTVRSTLQSYYFQGGGSEEEILNSSRMLVALGLIEPDYNLLTHQLNTLAERIGGFYRYDTNQIYLLGDQFTAVEKYAYVQEYSQALINQNFEINNMDVYPRCEGNEDGCRAIRALIKGDSALLSLQWLEQEASPDEYDEIQNYRLPTFFLLDRDAPPFSRRNVEFPYVEGKAFVEALFSSGGWTRVSTAYDRLPLSTEQILHPEKYLSAEQPIAVPSVDLGPILGDDWRQIKDNILGEWFTYLVLRHGRDREAQVDEITAELASEGWGGDRYQVYTNDETDETILVAHWRWDDINDSNEFSRGMSNYLKKRFSSGESIETDRECWYGVKQYTCLYTDYLQSLWILAPSVDFIDIIETLYPDF